LEKTGKSQSKKQIHQITFSNASNQPEFGITFSHWIALRCFSSISILLTKEKAQKRLSFKCYSSPDRTPFGKKKFSCPYTQEIVQVHQLSVRQSTAILYMMSGRNPAKDSKLWQKPQGARYVVFYYNAKTNKLKEYDISLKDKQVLSVIWLQLNQKQDVIITGYYSNDFQV
jgi:hypothetical protein